MTDVQNTGWRDAERQLPKTHTEIFEDFDESWDYEVSDPVLAVTVDGECVVAKFSCDECGKPCWYDDDGTDYKVRFWQPLPVVPEEVSECPEE